MRKAILFGIVSALVLTSAATAQTPVQKLQQAGKISLRLFNSPVEGRHNETAAVAYADGHAKSLKVAQANQ
ncbi:MAG: hypothetical protein CFK48_10965, partial [Armatimonadetes bacterium CP1_7O]